MAAFRKHLQSDGAKPSVIICFQRPEPGFVKLGEQPHLSVPPLTRPTMGVTLYKRTPSQHLQRLLESNKKNRTEQNRSCMNWALDT